MRRISIIALFSVVGLTASAERIVFEMSIFGYTFGEMVLTKTVKNDSVEVYTLKSKGETNLLWLNRKGESELEVEYLNGKMYSSEYSYFNHGELEKWSKSWFDGDRYVSETNDGKLVLLESPAFSLIRLYFEPNCEGDSIFCEEDGSYAALVHDSEKGVFDVRCQDGSRSTYHVKDGTVEMMEIHLGIANVMLIRVR